MDDFEKYKLEKSLIALWLTQLRLSIGNRFGTLYYSDEELLNWAKENIKQKIHEENPKVFLVYYEDELLFEALEMDYHKYIKYSSNIEMN